MRRSLEMDDDNWLLTYIPEKRIYQSCKWTVPSEGGVGVGIGIGIGVGMVMNEILTTTEVAVPALKTK